MINQSIYCLLMACIALKIEHGETRSSTDGCSSYRYLQDQPGSGSRAASYVPQATDPLLCDAHRGLDGKLWWRFNNSRIPEYSPGYYHCSTYSAMWILGKHPKDYATTTVEVCATDSSNSCSWRKSMQVQRCLGPNGGGPKSDFFVYQLIDPEECDRAYCTDVTCSPDEKAVPTTVMQCIAKRPGQKMTKPESKMSKSAKKSRKESKPIKSRAKQILPTSMQAANKPQLEILESGYQSLSAK